MCLQRICALCSNLPSGRNLLEVREKLLLRNLKRPTTLPFQKMGIGTNFKFVTLSIDSKASASSGTVQIVKLCVTSLLLSSTGKANHILALEKLIFFSVDLLQLDTVFSRVPSVEQVDISHNILAAPDISIWA